MSVAIIAHAQSLSVGYVIGLQHNEGIAQESTACSMQIESDAMTPCRGAVLHCQGHAAALGWEALAAGFVVAALLGGLGWTWAKILEQL
ncbi:MAG: hypothetical protein ABIT83_19395 [Massilia sp.]